VCASTRCNALERAKTRLQALDQSALPDTDIVVAQLVGWVGFEGVAGIQAEVLGAGERRMAGGMWMVHPFGPQPQHLRR